MVHVYVPPGWPAAVRPPGASGWERTAVAFLLDCCPSEYRGYQQLQRHPVVLARFARVFVDSQLAATRANLSGARSDLAAFVDSSAINGAVSVLQREEARLVRVLRSVGLVEQGLRDVRFTPKL